MPLPPTEKTPERNTAIRDLIRAFSDATILLHDTIARQAGLSGADHKYLGLLVQHGPLTAGEWARRTGLSTGAVTGLIDRLEKKQLVQRTADTTDRRKQVIVPNRAQAEQLFGNVFADLRDRTAQFLATLTESEAATVEHYLRATTDIMRDVARGLPQTPPSN